MLRKRGRFTDTAGPIHIRIGWLICAATLAAIPVAKASMQDNDKIVVETEQALLLETLKLCESPDSRTLVAAIPAFSGRLLRAGVEPNHFDEDLAAKGMVTFSAWGFIEDKVPEALKNRSFFVDVRMHEAAGRTVSYCEVTDMKPSYDEKATALSTVEAAWLDAIAPWTSAAATTHVAERAATASQDAAFERSFDLSTAEGTQWIHMLRVGHKVSLTMLRSSTR